MDSGTWGEWAGAIGTTLAAGAALYLGLRDDAARLDRQEALRDLRAYSVNRRRVVARWRVGIGAPDAEHLKPDPEGRSTRLDQESAPLVALAERLPRGRRRRALRYLVAIYGQRSVSIARMAPERWDRPNGALARYALWMGVVTKDPALLSDAQPPLRVRGAGDDMGARADLERAFGRLARL